MQHIVTSLKPQGIASSQGTTNVGERAVEHSRFDGAGLTLAGSTGGPAVGVPVLVLHGGGQTRYSWARALHETARRGYRAISLDLCGHGDSDWSPDGAYSLAAFRDDVACVDIAARIEPAGTAEIGNFMGSAPGGPE